MLMLAIVILAVSMLACGASQKSQTQTTPTELGDWTGIITGAPAPFPASISLSFGIAQSEYATSGWFDSNVPGVGYACWPGAMQQVPVVLNGANFTMTNTTNNNDSLFTMTGTVAETGNIATATGTITFPSLCGMNAWTGAFTATQLVGGTQLNSGGITGGWTGTITGLGNVSGSFTGTSEFQLNVPNNGNQSTISFPITGCGSVSVPALAVNQNGLAFESNGTEYSSSDEPGNVSFYGTESADGQSISGIIYFLEPCSPNLAWEAKFSATSQ